MGEYLQARQVAKSILLPRRVLLYRIYDDALDTDSMIGGQWKNRVDRISNKPFKMVNKTSKVQNPAKTDFFKKAWFFDFLEYALECRTYGHSLIYTNQLLGNAIKSVDVVYREHVIPETAQILFEQSDQSGPSFLDARYNRYCISVGKPTDLGIMERISPLWILKKHSWQSWDQFEEMFGVPIRWAKTASTDKKVQAQITKWLQDMGQASYALFPEGTTFDVKESMRSDAFQVFEQKRVACNQEIAMAINGQFETSSASGSRAKAQTVVASTQDELTLSDLRFLYYIINDQLIPLMQGLGYDLNPDTDVFEWDLSVELKPLEKIQLYTAVNAMGYELDQDDITTQFGVKITGKKAPPPPPPVIPPAPKDNTTDKADPTVNPEDEQDDKPTNKQIGQIINMHQGIAKLYTNV
jgi:hypothetical protein